MNSLLFTVLLVLFSTQSFAGFLVEPYIGYRTGSSEQTSNGSKDEYDISGHSFGARLGYTTFGLSLGLQYEMGAMETEQTKPVSVAATDNDSSALGAFVGFSLPLIRFWGTYFFDIGNEVSKDNAAAGDVKGDETNGSGYALGVGFTGLPLISINLEYRIITIDELIASGVTYNLPTANNSEVDAKEFMLSVSVPLEF